jgi:hypothetical protein
MSHTVNIYETPDETQIKVTEGTERDRYWRVEAKLIGQETVEDDIENSVEESEVVK